MKTLDLIAALNAKAEDGDTMAQVALLLHRRMGEQNDTLKGIDGVLTEIRNAIEYNKS